MDRRTAGCWADECDLIHQAPYSPSAVPNSQMGLTEKSVESDPKVNAAVFHRHGWAATDLGKALTPEVDG